MLILTTESGLQRIVTTFLALVAGFLLRKSYSPFYIGIKKNIYIYKKVSM